MAVPVTSATRRTVSALGPRSPNRWVVLVVLCAALLLVAVDSTVLQVTVPALSEDLHPDAVALLWIVDAYPLVCASLLIFFGTLADRVGRKRILLLGYAGYAAASALAAFAATPMVLIAARGLLGVGGAMIMPATLSMLRQVFPDRRERATAIGVWSAVAAAGAAVGPVLGGFLVQHFWWGSVFVVNVPLMALSLSLGWLLLPESTGDHSGCWDRLGALIAMLGVLGVVFAVQRAGGDATFLDPSVFVPLAGGIAALAVFVRRQGDRDHPLIDVRLFTQPGFAAAAGCVVLAMLALVGLALAAVQYLQLILGLSPFQAGLRLLPMTLAAITAGLCGSRLLRLLGPRALACVGFCLTGACVTVLTVMGQHDRPTVLTLGFLGLGFGVQTTLFASYETMFGEVPAGQAAGVAAIGETAYQLGAGLGIAVLGSVLNAVYAPGVSVTSGVSPASRAAARHSLGEAYQVAGRLPVRSGEALRAAARAAFVHGLHITLLVSAGLLVLGALAALRLPATMGPSSRPGHRKAVQPPQHALPTARAGN